MATRAKAQSADLKVNAGIALRPSTIAALAQAAQDAEMSKSNLVEEIIRLALAPDCWHCRFRSRIYGDCAPLVGITGIAPCDRSKQSADPHKEDPCIVK